MNAINDTCAKCNAPVDDGGNWGFCDVCAVTEVDPVFENRLNPKAHDKLVWLVLSDPTDNSDKGCVMKPSEIILELSCRLADESDYEGNLKPKLQILLNQCLDMENEQKEVMHESQIDENPTDQL